MSKTALQVEADKFARDQGMPESDLTLIERFKSRVINFKEALDNLNKRRQLASRFPDMKIEYDAVMKRGALLKSTISAVTSAVDKVLAFFKGVTGMDGLGIAPLLPIAAISLAIAGIAKWTTDAYQLSKRLDAVAALEAKGYSPERASAIVSAQFPAGIFDRLSNLMPWLAAGAVLYFVWRARQ